MLAYAMLLRLTWPWLWLVFRCRIRPTNRHSPLAPRCRGDGRPQTGGDLPLPGDAGDGLQCGRCRGHQACTGHARRRGQSFGREGRGLGGLAVNGLAEVHLPFTDLADYARGVKQHLERGLRGESVLAGLSGWLLSPQGIGRAHRGDRHRARTATGFPSRPDCRRSAMRGG